MDRSIADQERVATGGLGLVHVDQPHISKSARVDPVPVDQERIGRYLCDRRFQVGQPLTGTLAT